jgi:hypothetical protein
MSSTSSQELAASASGSKEPECEPLASAKSTCSAERCLPETGQTFFAMTTCEPSSRSPLTSSPAASPAKMPASVKPNGVNEQALTASELVCGERSSVWPLTYDPELSYWRTCQASLVPGSDEFSATWPRSGMMLSGVAYLHARPASPIDVTESGLLPTPAARDFRDLSAGEAFLSQRRRHSPSLATKLLERGVHWSMISQAYEVAMGFPSCHTAVELDRSEIRLSRLSLKRSAGQS